MGCRRRRACSSLCFARLSDRFHLVAPDYPGFGHSDWPDRRQFAYTFDHIAQVMDHFTEALGLAHYTLYMQDYGGPVGFRMALAHPDRVEALIVQDAVAHNEGLGANWKTRRAFWADRATNESRAADELAVTGDDSDAPCRQRSRRRDAMIPISGPMNSAFLNQPGQADIQSDLFYDYRTNVAAYPKWQAWMRKTPAAPAGDLGQVRSLVRALGAGGLSPRRAGGGGARPRRRAFRVGHGCR